MVQGLSFKTAMDRVRENHKPICMGCGSPMPRVGYFCSAHSNCRKLYSRFYKKRQKGMSVQDALEAVLSVGNG